MNIMLLSKLGILVYASDLSKQIGEGKLEKIIEGFALAAAATNFGLSHLPGAGGVCGLLALTGIVYALYIKINRMLGIKFSKKFVRSVATMLLSNIAMNAVALIGGAAASSALSFFPGIASASARVYAGVCFGAVWTAGMLYLEIIGRTVLQHKDLSKMSKADVKKIIENTADRADIPGIVKTAMILVGPALAEMSDAEAASRLYAADFAHGYRG